VDFQEKDLCKGFMLVPDINWFEKEDKKREIIIHCTTKRQVEEGVAHLKSHHYQFPLSREMGGKKNHENIGVREETKLFPF